jgi:hypothetical protein
VLSLELVIPVFIIIALGLVKLAIKDTTIPASLPSSYTPNTPFKNMYEMPPCNSNNLVVACKVKGYKCPYPGAPSNYSAAQFGSK